MGDFDNGLRRAAIQQHLLASTLADYLAEHRAEHERSELLDALASLGLVLARHDDETGLNPASAAFVLGDAVFDPLSAADFGGDELALRRELAKRQEAANEMRKVLKYLHGDDPAFD